VKSPESRASLLSRIGPRGWWAEHTGHCRRGCYITAGPDKRCDVGEALFRLSMADGTKRGAA
jgi:hypothetical protein